MYVCMFVLLSTLPSFLSLFHFAVLIFISLLPPITSTPPSFPLHSSHHITVSNAVSTTLSRSSLMKCMGDVLQYRKQSRYPALWGSMLELWEQAARVYSRKVRLKLPSLPPYLLTSLHSFLPSMVVSSLLLSPFLLFPSFPLTLLPCYPPHCIDV